MIALSIRQPWAWMILHAGKDIENRDWITNYRGRCLLHTGKQMTDEQYAEGAAVLKAIHGDAIQLPPAADLPRGGIVGAFDITDCVGQHASPWFFGTFGFLVANPVACDFVPYRGMQQFFNVDSAIAAAIEA